MVLGHAVQATRAFAQIEFPFLASQSRKVGTVIMIENCRPGTVGQ